MVHRGLDAKRLQRIMALKGGRLLLARGRYQSKELVKKLLGDHLYQQLWRGLTGRPELP
jgi:hypothetical protein